MICSTSNGPLFFDKTDFSSNHVFKCLIAIFSLKQWYISTNIEESTVIKQWWGDLTKIHIYQEQRPFESVTNYVLCLLSSDHPISFHHFIISHINTNISRFQGKAGWSNIEGVIWQKISFIKNKGPLKVLQIMFYNNFSI